MKPIIIYTLTRARSTAVLQACRRSNLMNEPFEISALSDPEPNHSFADSINNLIEYRTNALLSPKWEEIKQQMSYPDSAVKFFGTHLYNFFPAQKWFLEAEQTHEIFVLTRNIREVIWSQLLATKFGFHKVSETPLYETSFSGIDLYNADIAIDSFLRFYPKTGKHITFENLPEQYFDTSKITIENQNSLENKIKYITNASEIDKKIDAILTFRSQQWQDVTGFDIRT